MAVRKLLVVSQKSGVGKTTTSVSLAAAAAKAGVRVLLLAADPVSSVGAALNLAAQPGRRPLRQAGVDLPGVLTADAVPGLDVLSPYDEGACSDEDFGLLLQLLAAPEVQAQYGCLVVDAPPFLATHPAQLTGACDEFLLVMRAEAMAYRTLPAFLQLVQKSREESPIRMRGILLTLPENESPGGRWEREIRGRFQGQVLAPVIPYDEEAPRALEAGQALTQASPHSPAAVQYLRLVQELGLTAEAGRATKGDGAAALAAAATVLQPAAVGAAARPGGAGADPADLAYDDAESEAPTWTVDELNGVTTPPPPEARFSLPPRLDADPEAAPPVAPSAGRKPLSGPHRRPPRRAPVPEVKSAREPQPEAPPEPGRRIEATAAAPRPAGGQAVRTVVAVVAAAAAGGGLRFVPLPDYVLPIVVGLAVTAGALLVIPLLTEGEKKAPTVEAGRGGPRPEKRTGGPRA
jgi:chromosome partitioning protein